MNLIENERIRLTANALNTIATTCFGLGVLAPLAAAFYSVAADHVALHSVVIGVVFWSGVAFYAHSQARRLLGGLQE